MGDTLRTQRQDTHNERNRCITMAWHTLFPPLSSITSVTAVRPSRYAGSLICSFYRTICMHAALQAPAPTLQDSLARLPLETRRSGCKQHLPQQQSFHRSRHVCHAGILICSLHRTSCSKVKSLELLEWHGLQVLCWDLLDHNQQRSFLFSQAPYDVSCHMSPPMFL